MYDQDDLPQSVFIARETLVELESEYHFLLEGLEYPLQLKRYQLYLDWVPETNLNYAI